jgi:hypothetical protein
MRQSLPRVLRRRAAFPAGIELGRLAGEAGASEALEFIGQSCLDGLAAVSEPAAVDELVHPFE